MKKLIPLLMILAVLVTGCQSQKKSYKVTLDFADGTVIEVTTDSSGHVKIPQHDAREGYKLAGWLYNGEIYPLNSVEITSDMTLVAYYLKVFHVHVITDLNKDSIYEVLEGQKMNRPSQPQKEGYFFNGWYLNGVEYDFDTPVSSNITIVANWLKYINVSFAYSEEEIISTQSLKPGDPLQFPQVKDIDGFAFDCWQLDGMPVEDSKGLTDDVTLIAHYRQLHTVTFVCNDIYSYTEVVLDNESVPAPKDPYKENSRFVGWLLDGTRYNFSSKVTSDIVLSAQYIDIHTVTLNYSSAGINKIIRLEDGSLLAKPEDPSKAGFCFMGWFSNGELHDFSQPLHKDYLITAVFKRYCTVTFVYGDGRDNLSLQLIEDEMIPLPQDPAREGYEFAGWYYGNQLYDFSVPVTQTIVLNAVWTQLEEADG